MGRMLLSREDRRFARIDAQKVRAGRFLTTRSGWLVEPVLEFVAAARARELVDPFVGDGHLLAQLHEAGVELPAIGYDIEPGEDWRRNDSLRRVPEHPHALIVTNPPYLARHSAARKRVLRSVARYYDATGDHDLYQVALRRCLASAPHVVALLPETFLHAGVLRDRLERVAVIEASPPFDDTTHPICVACFGPATTTADQVPVYLDDRRLGTLAQLDALRQAPRGDERIRFNVPDGPLALQAVDAVDPRVRVAFMPRSAHGYDAAGIKRSSRLVTFIDIDGLDGAERIDALAAAANERVEQLRTGIGELALSPFKGNNRDGARRRRLDYRQARAILTQALAAVEASRG